jgi:hypothetical protein
MRLKIEGGTARHDQPSLCLSCRYAMIARGVSLRHEVLECRRLSEPHNRLTFTVTFCNGYVDRGHPTISETEEIAGGSLRAHRRLALMRPTRRPTSPKTEKSRCRQRRCEKGASTEAEPTLHARAV